MSVSPALVKELREITGAGMMDCKKALEEVQGDKDAAIDWLRKKGLAAAAKKSSRVASEGLVGVATFASGASLVEVNSETDFVSRNEKFQEFVRNLAHLADRAANDVEALKASSYKDSGKSVAEELTTLVATIGENMTLRRTKTLSVSAGVVATYIHTQVADSLGRIGVLVALESSGDKAQLEAVGRQIAMHIAATKPEALSVEGLSADLVAREKQIFVDQAKASGKPDAIIEKMVDGRLRKYHEEVVLLEQAFVMNPDQRVKDLVADLSKKLGTPVTLKAFARFALGEGIEKEAVDFAAEVAAQLKA